MTTLSIAHVLSSYALGGQERVAVDLAGSLVRKGHRVHAISLAPAPDGVLAKDFVERGVALHTLSKRDGVDGTLVLRLARLLRQSGVDVVHTHNPQPLFYGAPAGRLSGCAVVHTKHGVNPAGGRKLWLRRLGGRLAHAYVAVSEATARTARENSECARERLRVIANGIDLGSFGEDERARREVRDELSIPHDAFVFGTVGRMSPEKEHALLVSAAAPLLGPTTRLVIVGDGTEWSRVRAAAQRSPFVHLTGGRRDVARILSALDVFVLSSSSEGLPLALVEAMATGLPIVATDVGGVREVLAGAGLVVAARREQALRDAMSMLRANPGHARALGDRARLRARHYGADRMVDQYLALYHAVICRRAISREPNGEP